MPPARLADPEKWWWPAVALAILALLYYLSPILAPFLLGALLATALPGMWLWTAAGATAARTEGSERFRPNWG